MQATWTTALTMDAKNCVLMAHVLALLLGAGTITEARTMNDDLSPGNV
jgi:hypothetical protein